jgi:hypothetical protein
MASRKDPAPGSAPLVTIIVVADKFIAKNNRLIKMVINFFIFVYFLKTLKRWGNITVLFPTSLGFAN